MTIKQRKTVESDLSVSQADEAEYLGEYSNLLSLAAIELGDNFAASASPTMSKQETVTYLYEDIIKPNSFITEKYYILRSWMLFPLRIIWHFFNLIKISRTFKVNFIPKNCVYIRSWLVPLCFEGNKIHDEYFRGLIDDLGKHEKVVVALQPLNYKLIRKLKKDDLPDGYIIPIGFLSLTNILKCLLNYILNAKVALKGSYRLHGKEIRNKINRSLLFDYLKMRSFLAYQEKFIAKKLCESGIKAFLYVFENQSWEKVYCHILKENNINLIGYQSSGFSKRFLNFFPNKIDRRIQPQPHFLLTVGEGFSRYLTDNASYRSKIISFGALRFGHSILNKKFNIRPSSSVLHHRILYAFSVHLKQYSQILKILKEVFQNSSIQVDLKFHPLHVEYFNKLSNNLPENFQVIKSIENKTISDTYDLVIFNDNSYGIEALIYGVKTFELDLFGNKLDERLIYFEAWNYRINTTSLMALRNSLETGKFDKTINQDIISEYINYLYKPYLGDLSVILKAINKINPSIT